jgi:O-antigen ligase
VIFKTILILVYSLLPGFAKIANNRELFLISAPIIIFIFSREYNIPKSPLTPWVFFFALYSLVYTALLILLGFADFDAFLTSVFISVMPILGFFSFRKTKSIEIIYMVSVVAFIHALIGILIYGFLPLPGFIENIALILKDGLFQFRMSSVSGSIVFSSVCMLGLICSIYIFMFYQRSIFLFISIILIFGIVMSQQRGAWIASAGFLGWHLFKIKNSNYIFILFLALALVMMPTILSSLDPDYFDFVANRLEESVGNSGETNIITERSHMWLTALDSLVEMPLGSGLGQGGYVAHLSNVNLGFVVTDGEYFRVLQETGLIGIVCYLALICLCILSFFRTYKVQNKYLIMLFLAPAVQMIGSNLTELYFIGYLIWVLLGMLAREQLIEPNKT